MAINGNRDPFKGYSYFIIFIAWLNGSAIAKGVNAAVGSATAGYITFKSKSLFRSLIKLGCNRWLIRLKLISAIRRAYIG
jgi:hypothetical protein